MQDGLYVITYIKYGYENEGFCGQGYHEIAFSDEIINRTSGTTNRLKALEKKNYLLWHWHFNYLRPDKITYLYKVTNLSLPIQVPTKLDICEE
jgi:hypothetical protein